LLPLLTPQGEQRSVVSPDERSVLYRFPRNQDLAILSLRKSVYLAGLSGSAPLYRTDYPSERNEPNLNQFETGTELKHGYLAGHMQRLPFNFFDSPLFTCN